MENRIIKFNNKPNDHVTYSFNSPSTGIKVKQDFWVSRSAAIDVLVLARCKEIENNDWMILTIKRSKTMRDDPNKTAVPSGYMDWDEDGYEAMLRELYEETSLYLPDFNSFNVFDNQKQPFLTLTKPTINRQNIVLLYMTVLNFDDKSQEFPWFVESYKDKETADVKWMTYFDFLTTKREWAFNHDKRINDALLYYEKGRFDINGFYKGLIL